MKSLLDRAAGGVRDWLPLRAPRGRLVVAAVAAGLAFAVPVSSAAAHGHDPAQLEAAGWFCRHTPVVVHCFPDGDAVLSGPAAASIVVTFAADTDEFWGTELLIREDLYHGQPCPRDNVNGQPGTYIPLSALGLPLPYYVCHHFDSPLT